MLENDLPRERRRSDSVRAGQRPILLEAADRHARRLGVLGCIERRSGAVPPRKTEASAGPNLRRVALIEVPHVGPDWLKPIPSAVAYIRVAAA